VAPSDRRKQSEGEKLEFLVITYSHNSEITQELAVHAAALRAGRSDWRLAARVVAYRRVEWAVDYFALYKTPGMDGIFPTLLQEGREPVIPYLVRIFHACLSTGYVPAIWRRVRVVFISKPGRNFYSGPRDSGSTSLTSFFS
jgi:hypothetical protein